MISKTNKAVFAGVLMALVMLAAGLVVVGVADDSDAVPDPERVGIDGYPITVFKADRTSTGLQNFPDPFSPADGDEIWIYENISDQGFFSVGGGKSVTLHLHYCNITFADSKYIQLYNGALNIEGNGTITAIDLNRGYSTVSMFGNADGDRFSVLNVDPNITLVGYAAVGLYANGENNSGMVVDFAGKTTGSSLGMSINGTVKKTAIDDATNVINPHVPEITIRSGAMIDGTFQGIYAAGYGIWNIEGATISGGTGMEVRAGEVYANDTVFKGTSTPTTTAPNGSGTTIDGAGFAVSQHVTDQFIEIQLNSCTASGYSAFYQANVQQRSDDAISRISMGINGGEYTAVNNGTLSVYSQNFTGFINSGTFSTAVDNSYAATSKTVTQIGDRYCVGTQATPGSDGIVSTTDDTVIAEVESSVAVVKVSDATMSISGSSNFGAISFSAKEQTSNFIQAPNAIKSFEITIVTSVTYSADITVNADIPSGHKALVYYIEVTDDGSHLVPVKVVDFTSSTVTFRTSHNTPFVVMSEPIVETPSIPNEDEDYPFLPGNNTPAGNNSSKSSDNTTLVAAAAAIVVIMLAVVAIMTTKKN